MKPLMIGIGNALRGDDGLGCEFARRLMLLVTSDPAKLADIDVCESDGSALSLMDLWGGRQEVLVIDALMDPSKAPGTLVIIDVKHLAEAPMNGRSSIHSFGLVDAIKISKALAILPSKLTVIGVVGQSFERGDEVSEPVSDAVQRLVQNVALRWSHPGGQDA